MPNGLLSLLPGRTATPAPTSPRPAPRRARGPFLACPGGGRNAPPAGGPPILLTGTHRSGTTWVGHVIAAGPAVGYVHEPFNYLIWEDCRLDHYFHHVTGGDEGEVLAYLRHTHGLVPPRGRGLGRSLRAALTALRGRRTPRPPRPLVKDPFAFFSAEWWARAFGARVVVLVRHPAAVAASLKRLNWPFDFEELREQPTLMRTHLAPFREDLEAHARRRADILDDAVLLWRVVYHAARRLRAAHPDWVFLRHEDLSLRPEEEFRRLFARLGLEYTEHVRRVVAASTSEENPPAMAAGEAHRTSLNSRANVRNWRRLLRPEEVERVRRGTEDVAPAFYAESDWDPPDAGRG